MIHIYLYIYDMGFSSGSGVNAGDAGSIPGLGCLFLAGWVFLAARGLSLVVGSAGFSPAVVRGLLTAVAPLVARVLPRSLGSRGALI